MKIPVAVPSEADLLDFLENSPGISGKRDIAKAFGLKGAAKIGLKKVLKDMASRGVLDRKGKKLSTPGKLPPVATLDIVGFDDHGELYGIPTEWDSGKPPHVLIKSSTSRSEETRPPKPGDRVLGRIEILVDDEHYRYAARAMKNLSGRSTRVLGVYRSSNGEGRILSIDKKAKHDLQVSKQDSGDARDGELVSADIVRDRGRGLPQARIRERFGDVSDPRNISLIAIHQHGVPNNFPERVLEESVALKSFSHERRDDYRHVPLITIDPVDARDHDDAVFARPDDDPKNEGGMLSSSLLPMSRPMCGLVHRLIARREYAAIPRIFQIVSFPCCPSAFQTICVVYGRAKTVLRLLLQWCLTRLGTRSVILFRGSSCGRQRNFLMKKRRRRLTASQRRVPARFSSQSSSRFGRRTIACSRRASLVHLSSLICQNERSSWTRKATFPKLLFHSGLMHIN